MTPVPTSTTPKHGLWWSPQKQDGNGFDIHVNGDQLTVVWYTYTEGGSSIWYLGDGTFSSNQGSVKLYRFTNKVESFEDDLFTLPRPVIRKQEVGDLRIDLIDTTHATIA